VPNVSLAMSGLLGWTAGAAVAVATGLIAISFVKLLARTKVVWWPALVAPAAAVGPALGLLAGAWLTQGDVAAALFWTPGGHPAARVGWSLLVFFAATGAYGLVTRFLASKLVVEELGLRIPEVFLDLGRFVLWVTMVFVIVGGIWRRSDLFTALFTAGAATTLVLGLALQDTIKNFIAAWAIVGEGVYTIGDWVWLGDDEGEVVSVTRRTTKIRTRQGDIVTVPNNLVTASKVRNQSKPTRAHAELVRVHAAYDAAPNRVRDCLHRAAREVPKLLQSPAPAFRVRAFGDSGVEYEAKVWMDDVGARDDILSDLRVQIWYHFQREGIEFPYPVRELRRRAAAVEPSEGRARAVFERLRSVPFFGALPQDVLALLARDASLVRYGAGERVVLQGEPGDACYVVDDGKLAVLIAEGRTEQQVAVLSTGDLFGEISLLTGEPRAATVRAIGDARLVVVGSSSLRTALERSPELATRLAEVATLRREGLLEARVALDAAARARVDAQSHRLRELIRRFFKLPDATGAAPVVPPPARPGNGVAGGPPAP
jgi:small-conductance mechanosensitive channel/CRP-like cAMP-binding protein